MLYYKMDMSIWNIELGYYDLFMKYSSESLRCLTFYSQLLALLKDDRLLRLLNSSVVFIVESTVGAKRRRWVIDGMSLNGISCLQTVPFGSLLTWGEHPPLLYVQLGKKYNGTRWRLKIQAEVNYYYFKFIFIGMFS